MGLANEKLALLFENHLPCVSEHGEQKKEGYKHD